MAFNTAYKIAQEEQELEELLKQRQETPEVEEEEETETVPESTEEKPEEESEEETTEGNDGVDWKKRHGDLRRHSQKAEEKLKATIAELTSKVEKIEADNTAASLPASQEELEEWRQSNPNAFAIVETLASSIADDKFRSYKKELDSIRESVTEDKSTLLKEKADIKINRAHPDYEDLKNDDDFHDWAEGQPKRIQDMVFESTDADDVIWAINMYKLAKGVKSKPSAAKEAAKAVNTKGNKPKVDADAQKGKIRESEIQSMSEKEFLAREDEILKAQRAGNIIYDLSGGAR